MGNSNFILFALIPLILTIGIASALPFELLQLAEAEEAQGPPGSKSYGSKNNWRVCGDRLCTESEPTAQASLGNRLQPAIKLPKIQDDNMGMSAMIEIDTEPARMGERMHLGVEFEDPIGNLFEHVNFNIKATQNGQVVLDEKGVYDDDGEIFFQTMPLPADSSSESPVDVEVEFLGFGVEEPLTGPIGEAEEVHVVPEFGTVAVLILGVAIISIIVVTARSKVIPRMENNRF